MIPKFSLIHWPASHYWRHKTPRTTFAFPSAEFRACVELYPPMPCSAMGFPRLRSRRHRRHSSRQRKPWTVKPGSSNSSSVLSRNIRSPPRSSRLRVSLCGPLSRPHHEVDTCPRPMCGIGRHSRHAGFRIARTMGRPVAPRSEGPRPLICPKQSVLICRQRCDPHGRMFVVGGSVCEPLSRFSLLPHGPSLLARA